MRVLESLLTGVLEADTAMLARILSTFNLLWLSIPPNSDKNIVFFVVSLLQEDKYSHKISMSCSSCNELRPAPRPLSPRRSLSQKMNSDIISIATTNCLLVGAVRPANNCSVINKLVLIVLDFISIISYSIL